MSGGKHALIFGASGVSGWAFVNEFLNDYPRKGVWGRVTALTNRALSYEKSQWSRDERLSIVSGIDLLAGSQEDLENSIKSKVPSPGSITHVFYVGKHIFGILTF